MSLAWVLRSPLVAQPKMELKANRVRWNIKRTARSLTMLSPTGTVNNSLTIDLGKYEEYLQLDGKEVVPRGPAGRKAIYQRMEEWEANFKNWWRPTYGPPRLDWRRTDAATTTLSGVWQQQRFRLLPATMSFEWMQEFRPSTQFGVAADIDPPALPGILGASEIFRITDGAGNQLNINAMRVEEAMVGEGNGWSPPSVPGAGNTNKPINVLSGRVQTVYVIQGFVAHAGFEIDMLDVVNKVKDMWQNKPVTFYFGYRPGVEVFLTNMTANREATAPTGTWEVVIEMLKSGVWP